MKVWLVEYSEDFDRTFVSAVFSNKESAEIFINNESDPENYYLSCEEVRD